MSLHAMPDNSQPFEHALACRPGSFEPPPVPPRDRPETIFGAFLAALDSPLSDEPVRRGVVWTTFPIAQAVLFGFWPVFRRMAERRGRPLTDAAQLLDDVAPRVQRLLETGLLLSFPSAGAAAAAFDADVVAPTLRLAALHPDGATESFQALVMERACAFFVAHITEARTLAQRVEALRSKLVHDNAFRHGVAVLEWIEGVEADFAAYLDFFGGAAVVPFPGDDAAGASFSWAERKQDLQDLLSRLRARLRDQAALRGLPFDPATLVREASGRRIGDAQASLQREWLVTQTFLAASDATEREAIPESRVAHAYGLALAMEPEALQAALFRRLEAAGWRPDPDDRLRIAAMAERSFDSLRTLRPGDPRVCASLFTSIDIETADLGSLDAMQRAIDAPDVSLKDAARFADRLDGSIDWGRLGIDEFASILERGLFDIVTLYDRLPRLLPDIRSQARELLDETAEGEAGYSALVMSGRIILSPAEAVAKMGALNNAALRHWLRELLSRPNAFNEARDVWRELLEGIAKRPTVRPAFRELVARPAYRVVVTLLSSEALFHRERQIRGQAMAAFRKLFGRVLWRRLVFAAEVDARAHGLKDVAKTKRYVVSDGDEYRRWTGLADDSETHTFGRFHFPRLLAVKSAEMPRLLRVYSEARIFRWLHAGAPDVDSRWAEYARARDRFFVWMRAHPPLGNTVPTP